MIQHISGVEKTCEVSFYCSHRKPSLKYTAIIIHDDRTNIYGECTKCLITRIYNAVNNEKNYVKINGSYVNKVFHTKHTIRTLRIVHSSISAKNIHYFKLLYKTYSLHFNISVTLNIKVLYNDINDEHERKKYILENDIPLLSLMVKTEKL